MKPLRLLVSRKFAIFLLVILTGVCLAGVLLPDFRIAATPWLLPLPAFLFVSILACSLGRITQRKETLAPFPQGGEFSYETAGTPESVRNQTAGLLKSRGWQVDETRAEGIVAWQGEAGFWGSMVFHLGMLVILGGMVMSMVSRSSAGFMVTEGETKDLMAPGVIQAEESLMGPARVPLRITLKQFIASYIDGRKPVDYRALLWLEGEGEAGREYTAQVNRPFSSGGSDVYMDRYGFAPRFVLKKEDGTLLSDYYYTVSARGGKTDFFELPEAGEGTRVSVTLFPDFRLDPGNKVTNISEEPRNPGAVVTVTRGIHTLVDRVFVPMGKKVHFEGVTLQFEGWRYWAHFGISRDMGMPWLVAGFFVIVGGLVLRFAFPDRIVWVAIARTEDLTQVMVGGSGGYFPALFREELKGIDEQIEAGLGADHP